MYKGKATCKILKDIRKQIADENDIAFVTSECKYQGDCTGTCPKCEAELRYLEEELRKRKRMGKTAIVAGLSIGLATTVTSCGHADIHTTGEIEDNSAVKETEQTVSSPKNSTKKRRQSPTESEEIVLDIKDTNKCSHSNIWDEIMFGEDIPDDYEGVIEDDPKDNSEILRFSEEPRGRSVTEALSWMGAISNTQATSTTTSACNTSKDTIMDMMEKQPDFPGGPDALRTYLAKEVKFPETAKNNHIQGVVLTEFMVETDGSISNAKVIVGLSPECDEEALRVIMNMPKWIPGENQGKPVSMYYHVPISFKLTN